MLATAAAGCARGPLDDDRAAGPSDAPPAATATTPSTGAVPPPGRPVYLALGDSLAVGVGAPTGAAYVDLVHAALQEPVPETELVRLGVIGETTESMLAPGGQVERAEQALAAGDVVLVTIDIGANDGLGCALVADPACLDAVLSGLEDNLGAALTRLRAAAGGDVPVVAMDYYLPVPTQLQDDPAEVEAALALLDRLNERLRQVYSAAGVPVAAVAEAFGGDDPELVVERTCAWTPMCSGRPDIHPDAEGHAVIAEALLDVVPVPAGRPGVAHSAP